MKKLFTTCIVLLSGTLLAHSAQMKSVSSSSVSTKTLFPSAPHHLVARLSKATSSPFLPVLRWQDASSNEDGFVVERKIGKATSTPFSAVGTISPNEVSFTDTGAYSALLESSSTSVVSFTYRVTAFNQYGSSTSNRAVVVAPVQNTNVDTATDTSSISSAFSHGDFSVLEKHFNTTIADVNSMIKQKGERAMSAVLNTAKAKADTGSCVDISKNLAKGNRSAFTSSLQTFLIQKGLLSGEPSGFYGDLTVSAVKAYQRSLGLPETGFVYDFTRQAIRQETCN
jgi:hypothetical protein